MNWLLIILVFQNIITVLLTRHTRTVYNYDITHMLLITEILKFIACCLIERHNKGALYPSFQKHVVNNPRGALKVSVPALLYMMSNYFVYTALTLLSVAVFQVVAQSKLVVTALLSVLVFGRSYATIQWICMGVVCFGVSICLVSKSINSSDNDENDDLNKDSTICVLGIGAVLISNILSSFSGVYFEQMLKTSEKQQPQRPHQQQQETPSLWMFNIILSFYSMCIGLFSVMTTHLSAGHDGKDFFEGFAFLVWMQIGLFAGGGLLVAVVIKYLDSVQKGVSVALSTVLSSIMGSILEKEYDTFTITFLLGAALTIVGCFIFQNHTHRVFTHMTKSFNNFHSSSRATGAGGIVLVSSSAAILLGTVLFLNPFRPGFLPTQKTITLSFPDILKSHSAPSPLQGQFVIPDNYSDSLTFFIRRTLERDSDCGGCKVLFELHDVLKKQGHTVFESVGCPNMDSAAVQFALRRNTTLVMVLPEIFDKCPSPGVKSINVHWILAPLGIKSANHAPKWSNDLIFNYATSTAPDPTSLPLSNILQVVMNPTPGDLADITEDQRNNDNRSGISWMMRKGNDFHKEIQDIHTQSNMKTVEYEKSIPLFHYEYFVSYDPYTYWSFLASMQGTVSIVYPLQGQSKQEWALGTFPGTYLQVNNLTNIPGVAYGWNNEEIAYARETMHQTRDFLIKVKQWGETTVAPFTRDCYRRAQNFPDDRLEMGIPNQVIHAKFL
eukprot:Awhi_evm1s156